MEKSSQLDEQWSPSYQILEGLHHEPLIHIEYLMDRTMIIMIKDDDDDDDR